MMMASDRRSVGAACVPVATARNAMNAILFLLRPLPTADTPQGLCLDKGYDFDEVREIVQKFGFTAHIRARGEEAKAIKQEAGFKARRGWSALIAGRTAFGEYLSALHLACGIITWRATGLLK